MSTTTIISFSDISMAALTLWQELETQKVQAAYYRRMATANKFAEEACELRAGEITIALEKLHSTKTFDMVTYGVPK